MRKGLNCLVLTWCLGTLRAADSVTLANGDRLSGTVQKLENGILFLKSAYSTSPLQVDWKTVRQVTKDTAAAPEPIAAEEPGEPASWWREAWANSSVSLDFDQNYSGAGSYNQISVNSDIEYSGDRWDASIQNHYFYYGSNYQAYGRLVASRYLNGNHFFLFPYLFLGRQTAAEGGKGQIRQYGGGAGWTFRRGQSDPLSIYAGVVRSIASGFAITDDVRTDSQLDTPLYVTGVVWNKTFKSKVELTAHLYAYKPVLKSGHYAMATDTSVKLPLFGKTYLTLRAYDTPELEQTRLFSTRNLQISSGVGIEF